jgi:hypothetical protein
MAHITETLTRITHTIRYNTVMKETIVERYRLDCWCFIGFIALVSIVSVL